MLFPDPWGLLRRELWPRIIASYSSQAMHSLAVPLALPHRVWTLYGMPGVSVFTLFLPSVMSSVSFSVSTLLFFKFHHSYHFLQGAFLIVTPVRPKHSVPCTAHLSSSSSLMTWVLSDIVTLVHLMPDSQGQGWVLPMFVSPGPEQCLLQIMLHLHLPWNPCLG